MDGKLSWFANRMVEDPKHPFVEHQLETDLIYAHSLAIRRDAEGVHILVAEMPQGGWARRTTTRPA